MPDTATAHSSRKSWLRHLARIGTDHGFFQRLGQRHIALFVEEGDTLVLSFDRAERLWDQGEAGLPLGFDAVTAHEFSLLSLVAIGRTWFRKGGVDEMLRSLSAEGFFASYKQVLILGIGPDCGHAAARAAHHIPGARALLCRPAAAISATHAPFETRFRTDRRADPDTPLPLGPEALANAARSFILFDPTHAPEAAQAALFRAPGTTRIAVPHGGAALGHTLARAETLVPLTRALADATGDTLDARRIRALLRPGLRRDPGYRARLAARLAARRAMRLAARARR